MPVEKADLPPEGAGDPAGLAVVCRELFDEGAIPSRRVGTYLRALTADVLAYKQHEKEARLAVLDELAAEGQGLKLVY